MNKEKLKKILQQMVIELKKDGFDMTNYYDQNKVSRNIRAEITKLGLFKSKIVFVGGKITDNEVDYIIKTVMDKKRQYNESYIKNI